MGRSRLPTHQGGTGGEEHMTGNDEGERGYVIKVGAWIRSIRCQQQLSLQDVEAASDHEFKASVLGAYERGERAISVPRLQRLARFYRVPVDQMLPHDDELGLPSANGNAPVVDLTERVRRRPVTLDLQAIEQMGGTRARCSDGTYASSNGSGATTTAACSPSGGRTCGPWPASSTAIPIRCRPGWTAWASA
jgi:transcriptional regulator with XRE-family HTH domain